MSTTLGLVTAAVILLVLVGAASYAVGYYTTARRLDRKADWLRKFIDDIRG